jgi:hypothetical protein
MPKFEIKVVRNYEYAVFVEAANGHAAIEVIRDYEIEDLDEFEVAASFDYEEVGEVPICMSCEGRGFDVRDEDCGNCEGNGYFYK